MAVQVKTAVVCAQIDLYYNSEFVNLIISVFKVDLKKVNKVFDYLCKCDFEIRFANALSLLSFI